MNLSQAYKTIVVYSAVSISQQLPDLNCLWTEVYDEKFECFVVTENSKIKYAVTQKFQRNIIYYGVINNFQIYLNRLDLRTN